MSIDALTHNDAGVHAAPASSEAWGDWVSATRLRGYLLGNTLGDWLNMYGEANGFRPDDASADYNDRLVFPLFIMEQGVRFESAVAAYLASFCEITTISQDSDDVRDLETAQRTFYALADGCPIIHQAALWNAESKTYGVADFLIRSDVFDTLFPEHLVAGEAATPAPDLGGPWHYVVVDAKFTTIHLNAAGEVGNTGSSSAYKAQLQVYNAALSRLQGYASQRAFLLGRGWEQRSNGGFNAMERLGPVAINEDLAEQATDAAAWVRRLRTEGKDWSPLPAPMVPELRPSEADWPWADATKQIIEELEDPIKLWQVGRGKRDTAIRNGVKSWRAGENAEAFGVSGSYVPKLQAILDVNRSAGGPVVRPVRVSAAEGRWREPQPLEFFVDFEYVSDLSDNFSTFPERGGQPTIFMIGCGHMENGAWQFRCFIADRLDAPSEARAIDTWLTHMQDMRSRTGNGQAANVFHWAPAEETNYETAYNSASKRHPAKGWPEVHWFDLFKHVIRAEPMVVRGAFAFGLKAVAQAFHSNGLIETSWGDSPVDGVGAMVGAWRCDEEAAQRGVRLIDTSLMQRIADYNEVDCKVMQEILHYLRTHH